MRQRVKAPHHIEALSRIRRDRRFRLDIVEGLVGNVDSDARRLLEGVDHLHEGRVFGFDKTAPAQHVDLGVGFGLERRGLRPGGRVVQKLVGADRRDRRRSGGSAL
jgi:hypothetical protein